MPKVGTSTDRFLENGTSVDNLIITNNMKTITPRHYKKFESKTLKQAFDESAEIRRQIEEDKRRLEMEKRPKPIGTYGEQKFHNEWQRIINCVSENKLRGEWGHHNNNLFVVYEVEKDHVKAIVDPFHSHAGPGDVKMYAETFPNARIVYTSNVQGYNTHMYINPYP